MQYLVEKRNYGCNNHGFYVSDELPIVESNTISFKELRQLHKKHFRQYIRNEKDTFDILIQQLPKYDGQILGSTYFFNIKIISNS